VLFRLLSINVKMEKTIKEKNELKNNNKMFQPHYLKYSPFISYIHLFSNLIICMGGYDAITAIMVQFCPFFSLGWI